MQSKVVKLGLEGGRLIAATARYRSNPLKVLARYWALYRHRKFSPDEIHFFKLLDPALSADALRQVVSKEELLAVQRRLNPQHLHGLTEDKIRFHAHCVAAGLPVPEILALYDADRTLETGIQPILHDADGIDAFLQTAPPVFIVKPVAGVHGEGVTKIVDHAGAWRNNRGDEMTGRGLREMFERSPYRAWMFQEFIRGHPLLRELSSTDALQTLRVVTIASDERVEIAAARLRLICGRNAHDNFDYGRTGNLIAILDPHAGTVRRIVGGTPGRPEMRDFTRHPVTGASLPDFQVPDWDSVKALVHRAARAFLPLVTIGWDVALTAQSPCLIEGNVTWDTLSGDVRMGEIYRRLRALAENAHPTPD